MNAPQLKQLFLQKISRLTSAAGMRDALNALVDYVDAKPTGGGVAVDLTAYLTTQQADTRYAVAGAVSTAGAPAGLFRTLESFYLAGDKFSDTLERALTFMGRFRTPIVQHTPMTASGLSDASGRVFPTRSVPFHGTFYNVRTPGIFIVDDQMDVKRIVAGEAPNLQWPVLTQATNGTYTLQLGHAAGAIIVTTQKLDYLVCQMNFWGVRFGLFMLEGINRPDFSGSDVRFNDVAFFHYQDAQSPKFDGVTAIYNGAMTAACCVGYDPASPYANRDNSYIDSPEFSNRQFYGQYNPGPVKPAVDAWFSASIIRAGQLQRINGITKRYVDDAGNEYGVGSNAVSLTGRIAYYPALSGRQTTAFIIDNIDERGTQGREMFFCNNDVHNLSLGRVTVENAGIPNTGKSIFYCKSLHSGNWAPELATENATANGALLIQTANGSGTSKLTRALTPAEIAALIGGGSTGTTPPTTGGTGTTGGGTTTPPASGGTPTALVIPAGMPDTAVSNTTGEFYGQTGFTAGSIDVTNVPTGAAISANQGIGYGAYLSSTGAFLGRYNTNGTGDSVKPAGATALHMALQTAGYGVLTLSYQ